MSLDVPAEGAVQIERRSNLARLFAEHPGKRATERAWLLYTPVWGIAAAVVMLGGFANTWGDAALTTFCAALGGGALVYPIATRPAEERDRPWYRSTAFKMGLSVTLFALLINYSHSPFFFDVLHMHYGFDTTLNVHQTPVGLYLITIAYFSTYSALCLLTYRTVQRLTAESSRWIRWPAVASAPFAVAFLETAMNANPFMTHLFCYDDLPLTLTFGTFAYGTAFCFALPVWLAIDERPGASVGLLSVVVWVFAAVYAEELVLDVLRHHVAPFLTTVEPGAQGFRDFADSCLQPL